MVKVIISWSRNDQKYEREFQLAEVPNIGECVYFMDDTIPSRITIVGPSKENPINPMRNRAFFDGGKVYLIASNYIDLSKKTDIDFSMYIAMLQD